MLAELELLRNTNNDLMAEIELLKRRNDPATVEKIESLIAENRELKAKVPLIFQEIDTMASESTANQEFGEKFQKIASEIEKLSGFLKDKADEPNVESSKGFHPHTIASKKKSHKKRELEKLKLKILELENENKNLRRAATLPKATLEVAAELHGDIQDVKKSLRQVREEGNKFSHNNSNSIIISTKAENFQKLVSQPANFESEIAPASIQLTEAFNELENLRKEVEEGNSEHVDFVLTLTTAGSIREKFEQAVENLKRKLDEKMKFAEEVRERNIFLERSMNTIQSENQKFESGMWELDRVNQQLKKTIETMSKDIEGVNTQLSLRDNRIAELENDKRSLMSENERLTREVVEIKSSEDATEGHHKQLIYKLSEEVNELNNTLKLRDVQLQELQVQLDDQALLSSELAEAKRKIQILEDEIQNMNILLEERNTEVASFSKRTANVADLKAEIQSLLDERMKLLEERDNLTKESYERGIEIENLKLSLSKFEDLRKVTESLQRLVNEKDKHIQEMTANFKILEEREYAQSEALGNVVQEKAHLLQELEKLLQESEKMRKELDHFMSERDHLLKTIESKNDEISVISGNLSTLTHEMSKLKKDRQRELEELEELRLYEKQLIQEKDNMGRNLEESDGRIAAMGMELNKLEDSLQGKVLELNSLKSEIGSLGNENAELRQAVEDAQILNQKLKEQMEKESRLLEAFANDKNSLIAQIDKLNQERSELVTEKESLLEKLHERESQAAVMLEHLGKLQDQMNLASCELDLKRSKTAVVEHEDEALRDELSRLKLEYEQLKSALEKVSEQRDGILRMLSKRQGEVATMSETVDKLQEQLTIDTNELDSERTKAALLEGGVFNLEEQLATYQQENQTLKNQIIQLEGLIDEHKELKGLFKKVSKQRDEILGSLNERDSQIEALKKELEQVKRALAAKSAEYDSLLFDNKEKARMIEKLHSELRTDEIKVGQMKNELGYFKAQHPLQPSVVGLLDQLNSERDELVMLLDDLKKENDHLVNERDTMKQLATERDFQIADMARTLKAMQEETQYIRSGKENSRKMSESFEIMVQSLTSERDHLLQQNEIAKQQLTELAQEKNRLLTQIEQKDFQLSDLPRLQEDIDGLVLELDKFKQQVAILSEKADDLINQLFRKNEENSQLRTRIIELSNLRKELFELKRQLNYVTVDRDSLSSINKDKGNTIATYDTMVDFLNNAIHAKTAHNEFLTRSVDRLEADLARLKQELANRNKIIEEFHMKHHEMKATEHEREELRGEVHQSRTLHIEIDKLRAERDKLARVIQDRESEIMSLNRENDSLLQFINNLKSDRDELIEGLHARDTELKHLKNVVNEAHVEMKILRGELSAYETQNEKLMLIIQGKDDQIDSLKERVYQLAQFEYKLQNISEENHHLRQELQEHRHLAVEFAHLQQDLAVMMRERDKLLYDLRESRTQAEKFIHLTSEYNSMRECLEASEREIVRLGNEVAQRDEYIKELEVIRERFENLSHSYKQLSELQEVVNQDNIDLKHKCEELQSKITEAEQLQATHIGSVISSVRTNKSYLRSVIVFIFL